MNWERMKALRAACTTLLFLSVSVMAAAQDASITGRVTDESGAILPGVTVTASSPAHDCERSRTHLLV